MLSQGALLGPEIVGATGESRLRLPASRKVLPAAPRQIICRTRLAFLDSASCVQQNERQQLFSVRKMVGTFPWLTTVTDDHYVRWK